MSLAPQAEQPVEAQALVGHRAEPVAAQAEPVPARQAQPAALGDRSYRPFQRGIAQPRDPAAPMPSLSGV